MMTNEWIDYFKSHWWLYLIMIGFFFSGIFVSAKYYQNVCNEHIIETFYNDTDNLLSAGYSNDTQQKRSDLYKLPEYKPLPLQQEDNK